MDTLVNNLVQNYNMQYPDHSIRHSFQWCHQIHQACKNPTSPA